MTSPESRVRPAGAHRRVRRAGALLVIATGAAFGLTACGGLSADSTCADFNSASANDQVAVVQDLFHKAHADYPVNGPATTNAVYNVTYECSVSPSTQLGRLGDFRS